MRQFILVSEKQIKRINVEEPVTNPNQIKIRVKAIGICGSDIHAYHGEHPFMGFPIVLGHECSGVVVECGEKVTDLIIGDRVVLRPQVVCGKCKPCREGKYNICESLEVIGCQITGACSDYFVANADLFYKIPDELGYSEATIIEPLAVAVHAVKQLSTIKNKNILVLGAGAIGNLLAQVCKGFGAASVMITDLSEEKLKMAKKCDIDYTINTSKENLAESIINKFGEDGVDGVFECTASPEALNQVLSILGKGTPIVLVGVFKGMPKVNLANVQDREYSLTGSLMYVEDDYYDALNLIKKEKMNLEVLITDKFMLEDINVAYKYIEDNKDEVQKVILNT